MNTQPRHPKCRALPIELHPDIEFLVLLSVVNPVVYGDFWGWMGNWIIPANAAVSSTSGLRQLPSWIGGATLPNVARYQLRYTRIFKNLYSQPQAPSNRLFFRQDLVKFSCNTPSIPAKSCFARRKNLSLSRHFLP